MEGSKKISISEVFPEAISVICLSTSEQKLNAVAIVFADNFSLQV